MEFEDINLNRNGNFKYSGRLFTPTYNTDNYYSNEVLKNSFYSLSVIILS